MYSPPHRSVVALAIAALAFLLVAGVSTSAAAEKSKTKTKRANGRFLSYNPDESTIIVKEGGKERIYNVKAEGSVLTRTTVTMNAKPKKITDLPEGAPVIVYWKPDENDEKARYARKIDAPKIPKEFMDLLEE